MNMARQTTTRAIQRRRSPRGSAVVPRLGGVGLVDWGPEDRVRREMVLVPGIVMISGLS
jgi:hypothetical protein